MRAKFAKRQAAGRTPLNWLTGLGFGLGLGLGLTPAWGHDSPPLPRELRLRAVLDGAQVVRPATLRPPLLGSESSSRGVMDVVLNTATLEFRLDLQVSGIDPADLHELGPNATGIHIHHANPSEIGPILVDLHHLTRAEEEGPAEEGPGTLERTEDGFRLRLQEVLGREQGKLDAGFSPAAILSLLRREQSYVTVHTINNELFKGGEIRGHLRVVPERLEFDAALDGTQVVRPGAFRPPLLGTASLATGTASLTLNTRTGYLFFAVEVDGISPDQLDNTHGSSSDGTGSAVILYEGGSEERGELLVDLQALARQDSLGTTGIVATTEGFRLHGERRIADAEGRLSSGRSLSEFVDLLRFGRVYLAVHTWSDPLFRDGEIRGNIRRVPQLLRFRATLDEAQVVRPPVFQPPAFGTGSPAIGEAALVVDKTTGRFECELNIEGITPDDLSGSVGANLSAVLVNWGAADLRGPPLIDLHYLSQPGSSTGSTGYDDEETPPEEPPLDPTESRIQPTDSGFSLEADGFITRHQGLLDTGFLQEQTLAFLRSEEAYLSIHTKSSLLFLAGEIRGNLRLDRDTDPTAREVLLSSRLDESQVVVAPDAQPPLRGSGSEAFGDARLIVHPDEATFEIEVEVEGIFPDMLDGSHGQNFTSIHVHLGDPLTDGPILLDVEFFARRNIPGVSFLVPTEDGFLLVAEGRIDQFQGRHDTGFTPFEIVDAILAGEASISVHSSTTELFSLNGEIRGNLRRENPLERRAAVFLRGDCDGDGAVAGVVTDAVFLLNANFGGGGTPGCLAACDANGDGSVTGEVTDAVYLLSFSFLGGLPPPFPFPSCDVSQRTDDVALGCRTPSESCR